MAKDALNVSKMNVNPEDKQLLMHSTVYSTNQTFQLKFIQIRQKV